MKEKKRDRIINRTIAVIAAIVGCASVYFKSNPLVSDAAECIIEETMENVLDLPDGAMRGKLNLSNSGDTSD